MKNEITAQRAEWYKLDPQGESEDDYDFRNRVSMALRSQGKIIEAQEAFNNALYNDPNSGCMDGILGAIAMKSQSIDWGCDERRSEDEMVAGMMIREKAAKPDPSPAMIMMMLTMADARRR